MNQYNVIYFTAGLTKPQVESRMSNSKLRRLHDRAVDYCSGTMSLCVWLYRNQSQQYFASIEASGGVMKTIIKDQGGDPNSPINGQLYGLFFMARNDFGEPPPYSYFGPRRIQIRADELLRLAPNLYFADFYCMGRCRHYVIVVMTRTGSTADHFCRHHLIPLNSATNPFLRISNGVVHTSNTNNFDVEVFYTENLNITQLITSGKATMATVETRGQGHSTRGGKRKNPSCSICNIPDQHVRANTDQQNCRLQ